MFLILPVDQNVGALPHQTRIDFCAVLASVLHRDPSRTGKRQNGAAAADHAPTPKSATEPPITKRKLKNSKEPCKVLSQRTLVLAVVKK